MVKKYEKQMICAEISYEEFNIDILDGMRVKDLLEKHGPDAKFFTSVWYEDVEVKLMIERLETDLEFSLRVEREELEIARKRKAKLVDKKKKSIKEEKEIELYKTLREKYGDLK